WLMGAAPRYWGRRDACRLTVPCGGMFHTTSGSMRKATTTCSSACNALSWARNSASRSFSGCNTGNPWATAYCFTADWCNLRPRPAGLSGAVTTATISLPAPSRAASEATANSGVPMKMMRMLYFVFRNFNPVPYLCKGTNYIGRLEFPILFSEADSDGRQTDLFRSDCTRGGGCHRIGHRGNDAFDSRTEGF